MWGVWRDRPPHTSPPPTTTRPTAHAHARTCWTMPFSLACCSATCRRPASSDISVVCKGCGGVSRLPSSVDSWTRQSIHRAPHERLCGSLGPSAPPFIHPPACPLAYDGACILHHITPHHTDPPTTTTFIQSPELEGSTCLPGGPCTASASRRSSPRSSSLTLCLPVPVYCGDGVSVSRQWAGGRKASADADERSGLSDAWGGRVVSKKTELLAPTAGDSRRVYSLGPRLSNPC